MTRRGSLRFADASNLDENTDMESNTSTTPTTASAARPASTGGPPVQRQFVNFAFYKLDPAFRRLSESDKQQGRAEFGSIIDMRIPGLMCLTYSTVGLRPDCDFLLWRIGQSTDQFQQMTAAINKSRLGAYLTTPHSLVSMTK